MSAFMNTIGNLFFSYKHLVHRLVGLCYLIQYATAVCLFLWDFDTFYNSAVVWSLPLTGVIQTLIVMASFKFLKKDSKHQGYFSDKFTLSYEFISENLFFALILLFQWLYYSNKFYPIIKGLSLIENVFVFLPYVLRLLFPKTSFGDSIVNSREKTDSNKVFLSNMVRLSKLYYIFAKHYIGFFLNYIRFLDLMPSEYYLYIYAMLIFSAFATTISMFLHTLKFKKYIGAKTSIILYVISYLFTLYPMVCIFYCLSDQIVLIAIAFVGIVVNILARDHQNKYQLGVMILLNVIRYA
jgi:hypothetical protein